MVYTLCINLLRHHPMIAFTAVMRPIDLNHFSYIIQKRETDLNSNRQHFNNHRLLLFILHIPSFIS